MNHVKYWMAGAAEMPFPKWYTANSRPTNQRLKTVVLVLFKNSRFEVSRSLKIAEKYTELLRLFLNKVRQGVVARGRRWAQTDCSNNKLADLVLFFATFCVLGLYQDLAPRPKRVVRRVVGGEIQDSGSMKSRIRNADLLITHVLNPCVKLLTVLHISSGQGRSVDRTSTGSSFNQVVARGHYSAMRRSQHVHWLRVCEVY